MVEFDIITDEGVKTGGCVLSLTVRGSHEGELSLEELNKIDKAMEVTEGGKSVIERVDVESTKFEEGVSVEYIVQRSMLSRAISNLKDRLEHMTSLEEPFIKVDSRVVTFKE